MHEHTNDDDALLTRAEVAQLLRCSPRQVQRLAGAGVMPRAAHVGSLQRWSRRVLREWVSAGCPDLTKRPAQEASTAP